MIGWARDMGPARGNQINSPREQQPRLIHKSILDWTVLLGSRSKPNQLFQQREDESFSLLGWFDLLWLSRIEIAALSWLTARSARRRPALFFNNQSTPDVAAQLFIFIGWFSSSFQQTQLKSEFDWMKRANQAAPQAKSKQIKST